MVEKEICKDCKQEMELVKKPQKSAYEQITGEKDPKEFETFYPVWRCPNCGKEKKN